MDREFIRRSGSREDRDERFVAVKVDRDELDIDSRYQVAVSAISGQGGWPLTASHADGNHFTEELFSPTKAMGGQVSSACLPRSQTLSQKNAEVIDQAEMVKSRFRGPVFRWKHRRVLSQSDRRDCGIGFEDVRFAERRFGSLPVSHSRGPRSLSTNTHAQGQEATRNLRPNLGKMARGGSTTVGGAFIATSVDEHWIVPHFEKMCTTFRAV